MVICDRCGKTFRLMHKMEDKYNKDHLCGKCRNVLNQPKRIKSKRCPGCGKPILPTSQYCLSCFQLGERNHNYKHGQASKLRTCKLCGGGITAGSHTGICQECYFKSLFGKGNPNYRHGHYTGLLEQTSEYKQWKISVHERDNWICKLCGERCRATANAHHIFPKRDHPELVFDVDNGITLCPSCHEQTFGKEYEYIELLIG